MDTNSVMTCEINASFYLLTVLVIQILVGT